MFNERRPGTTGSPVFFTVVIVVAVLYFARVVFIPIALAVLFTFLLAPLTIRLRHFKVGRIPSALIIVTGSVLVLTVVGLLMASQLGDVAHKLPEYQQNVRKKMNSIRDSGGGMVSRATRFIHNISQELVPNTPAPVQPGEDKPVPVEIRPAPFAPFEVAQKVLGSVLEVILIAVIVIVFVIFLLIQREDLRDRLIRLIGAGRVQTTTQALDDAAQRLSRYLLAQLAVNAGFGLLVGIGLYFVGIPNPILWGILALILRYIPYLGIWIAAILPAIMAFAVEPGWVKVPFVFGLYFGIDLLIWNFVEPLLYGTSTGTSPVAILIAAVFWTWLWGPVGLLLSTPLTVCVVVLGRYVPKLEFLSILLSDEQVLLPQTRFYQRMLAMDLEEATEVAEEFLKGKSLTELNDVVLIPALTLAEEDRHRGRLDEEHQKFLFQNTRLLVEDVSERSDELVAGTVSLKGQPDEAEAAERDKTSREQKDDTRLVVCIPARDEADEIASVMLEQLLVKRGVSAKVLSCASLAGECINQIKGHGASVACIVAVPPFGYTNARYICRRLRQQFPELKLVALILTEKDVNEVKKRQPTLVVDDVGTSMQQAVNSILALIPGAPVRSAAVAAVVANT